MALGAWGLGRGRLVGDFVAVSGTVVIRLATGGGGEATIPAAEKFINCLNTARRSGSILLGRVTRLLRAWPALCSSPL